MGDGGVIAKVISIHAPLTGSDNLYQAVVTAYGISIHAPLTGSDTDDLVPNPAEAISIHAPLTGSDRFLSFPFIRLADFNPRSPYGERLRISVLPHTVCYFNPRSPYGERLLSDGVPEEAIKFQSTLPLRGATFSCIFTPPSMREFQSTLPLRGATRALPSTFARHSISIHAPLTGSDSCRYRGCCKRTDFNPRSPYGERPARNGRRGKPK